MTQAVPLPLTDDQRAAFDRDGYLLFPGILEANEAQELRAATDDVADSSGSLEPWRHPRLRELITRPQTLALLDELFGADYAFHHLHTARQAAGTPGVSWHHDYEQHPQTNRSYLMVHVFYYLNGLNGEVGDLLLWPGSQRSVMGNHAIEHLGTPDLPGSVTLDDVPPGSMAIVHSAVLHARRPKPGGEGHLRYFLDVSYCEVGTLWPSYWYPDWQSKLDELKAWQAEATATESHDALFDALHFFDGGRGRSVTQDLTGSIAMSLPEWTAP